MAEDGDLGKTSVMNPRSSAAFDVVVIGGGIIGSAVAYQIARRSDMKVMVVDKADGPATGSTLSLIHI